MDFKALLTDKLKWSEEEAAQILGTSIEQIRKWEINDDTLTNSIISKIVEHSGLDYNTVLDYHKARPEHFYTQNTWKKTDEVKQSYMEYIDFALDKMNLDEEQKNKYIKNLQSGIKNSQVKPSISIVGRSDTGKSTLINTLLGSEKMPVSWTPTTSIAVYIKHINDRPNFIKDTTWIFADEMDGENLWNVKKLYDKDYCQKWKIAQGDVDILSLFGTRQGEMSKKRAGAAVVFLDAPILCNCDILDLPGYGTEEASDDIITFNAGQKADILIYLSQANGFMRVEDINYLKENIRTLPVFEKKEENNVKPLSNLFVVASQANSVNNGNVKDLSIILQKGCENFCKTLAPKYWKKREDISGFTNYGTSILPKRFFTYTIDIPLLCKNFNSSLKEILEMLPEIINKRTQAFIEEYRRTYIAILETEIKMNEGLLSDKEEYCKKLQEIEDSELKRTKDNSENERKITQKIDALSIKSQNEFSQYYSGIINTDNLVSKMQNRNVKNNKEDINYFVSQIQDELLTECNLILEKNTKELSSDLQKYIKNLDEKFRNSSTNSTIDIDFDAGFAFSEAVGRIGRLGIIGGLAGCIASEAVGSLGSIAFFTGIGGNIVLGSSFFGPMGIAMGAAIIGVIGLIQLFSGEWEKNVAKKIVESYDDNDFKRSFKNLITDYWKQTESAFVQANREVEKKWVKTVEELRNKINSYDAVEIQNNIQNLKNILYFYNHIPIDRSDCQVVNI